MTIIRDYEAVSSETAFLFKSYIFIYCYNGKRESVVDVSFLRPNHQRSIQSKGGTKNITLIYIEEKRK